MPEEYDSCEICVTSHAPPSAAATGAKRECRLLVRHGELPKVDPVEKAKHTEELKSLEGQLRAVEELTLQVAPPSQQGTGLRLTFMFLFLPLLVVICSGVATLWLLRLLRLEKRFALRQ